MKIVVLDRNSVGADVSIRPLEKYGEVVCYNATQNDEAAERVKDADILVVNKTPMNAHTLEGATRLKLVCEFATGYDNVDLEYCRSRGIPVANVVNYSTAAVAQHTVALALYLSEKLPYYDAYVKQGEYASQQGFSHFGKTFRELDGKVWGIAGLGNIGRKVAQIAQALGCRVIFYSTSGNNRLTEYEQVGFEELLSQADILSLHCPLNERTHYLIDETALKKMKETAILINVARGPVVKEAALYKALTENWILAAGLDVLEKEPIAADNPLLSIQDSGRLIITPHMAWGSVEARTRLVEETCKNIEAFCQGRSRNVVNE